MPPKAHENATHSAQLKPYELTPSERLLRIDAVLAITGESKSCAYENMANPDPELRHPLPIKDGRSSLFLLSEVESYVAKKIARLPRKGA